jgi:TonB family protein
MRKSRSLFYLPFLLICAALCPIYLSSAQESDPFYTKLLQKAQKSFLDKNYEEAARDFEIASFGLDGNKILKARAYVYLSLSQYYLKDVKASDKSLHEAASIMGQEGFSKLEIYESAWPDLEKLMAFFNIFQSQKELIPKEVANPKVGIDPKPAPAEPEKKSGENKVAPANPAPNPPLAQKPGIKLDEIKEGDILSLDLVDSAPVVISSVPPIYPSFAGASLIEGTVKLRALISEKGDVIKIEIIKGIKDAFGFDQAALRAVWKWKFEAASVKGIRVKVWMPIAIEFRKTPASSS